MKHFVLFTLMIVTALFSNSQTIYRTNQSGNYSANSTWVGGNAGRPLATMNTPTPCNCKIVIEAGHSLKADVNISLTGASIILDGPGSNLTFDNNVTITLNGNGSIDIQSSLASITRGNANNTITLGGAQIYDGNFEFQSTTNGTVQGPASAAFPRATGPQFQNGTLPVKLSEFKLVSNANGVTLSWKTSLEINSSHFEIERSADGKVWGSKGSVNAAGNVSVDQNYSFTDAVPVNGTNYYRLKIVDIDAKYEYSTIKSVSFTAASLNVIAGPNPAYSFLTINVITPGNDPYRLRLISRSGQVVLDQKYAATNNRLQLNVSNYTDGTYFLEVTNSAGSRQINKVLIVRK